MYKGKGILALIPARAGSKRLKHKNIRLFSGKPLIAKTIDEAIKSRYLDRIIVSTDNRFIAKIAQKFGAEIPFIRPKELAKDESPMFDVVLHALNWAKQNKSYFDMVMLLQPTSPLRIASDIDRAIELFFLKKAKSVVSVCACEYHPYWTVALQKNGRINNFLKDRLKNRNSHQFPKFYRVNGAIYLAERNYLIQNKSFFGPSTFAYLMPPDRSVDIDTEFNLKIAECLIKMKYKSTLRK